MKKSLLFAAVTCLALMSCKKDFTCECTSSSTAPGSTNETTKYTIYEVSRGTAKRACVKTTSESTGGTTTYVYTNDCKLK